MTETPITPDEFRQQMNKILIRGRGDTEVVHSEADDLMCDLLEALGYGQGVQIFRNMNRWYA